MLVFTLMVAAITQSHTYQYEQAKTMAWFAIVAEERDNAGDVDGVCGTCNGSGKWKKDGQDQGPCPACDGTGKQRTKAATDTDDVAPPIAIQPIAETTKTTPAPTTPKPTRLAPRPDIPSNRYYVRITSADWCPPCQTFARDDAPVLTQAGVYRKPASYRNYDANKAACTAEGITTLPVIDIIDTQTGRRAVRIKGYVDANYLLGRIKRLQQPKISTTTTTAPPPSRQRTAALIQQVPAVSHLLPAYMDTQGRAAVLSHLMQDHQITSYGGRSVNQMSTAELERLHTMAHAGLVGRQHNTQTRQRGFFRFRAR